MGKYVVYESHQFEDDKVLMPDYDDIEKKFREANSHAAQLCKQLDAKKVGELEEARAEIDRQIGKVEARVKQTDSLSRAASAKAEAVASKLDEVRADLTQKIASGGKLEQIFRSASDEQIKRIDEKTDEFRKKATALIKSADDANRAACGIRDAVKVSQDQVVALHGELSKIAQIKEYAKCAEHFQSLAKTNADEALCIRDSLEAELKAVRRSNEDLIGDNRILRKRLSMVMAVGAAAVVVLGIGNTYVLTRMPVRFPKNEVVPQALQMPAVPASEAKPAAAASEPGTNSAGAPAKAQPAVTLPQESPTAPKPASASASAANPASRTVSSEKHDG